MRYAEGTCGSNPHSDRLPHRARLFLTFVPGPSPPSQLYVKKGEGFVSRAVANLLLNGACNARLLPKAALTNGIV